MIGSIVKVIGLRQEYRVQRTGSISNRCIVLKIANTTR